MPEGPETRRMADGISRSLVNKKITSFKFLHPSLEPLNRLETISILEATSMGKAVVIRLNNGLSIISHNQLYGKWTFNRPKTKIKTRRQLRIEFSTKAKKVRLWSATNIVLLKTKNEFQFSYIRKLGPDILDAKTTTNVILEKLFHKKVKNRKLSFLLLDQSVFAGLGNYLRSEILFFTGLNHNFKPIDLNKTELEKLTKSIKKVTTRAYKQKGRTLDYEEMGRLFGNSENFRNIRHMVFSRQGEPCFMCGTKIIKVMVASRRIFLCPICQKYDNNYKLKNTL